MFAPLLFRCQQPTWALIASYLRPEEMHRKSIVSPEGVCAGCAALALRRRKPAPLGAWNLREGRFQKHLAAVATILSTFFSGFEALYSHYKNELQVQGAVVA